jgi:hypothetical protein
MEAPVNITRRPLLAAALVLSVGLPSALQAQCLGEALPDPTTSPPQDLILSGSGGFSGSVSFDGSSLAVGDRSYEHMGPTSGAVFVYEGVGGPSVQAQIVTPGDAHTGHGFGSSVAIEGDWLAVLALPDSQLLEPPAIYMFERVAGTWLQRERLTPGDGGSQSLYKVELAGGTLVTRALTLPSAALVFFEYEGAGWTEIDRIEFGLDWPSGFTMDGDTLLVGDSFYEPMGLAHFYVRTGDGWLHTSTVTAGDPERAFGYGLALSGSRALIDGLFFERTAFGWVRVGESGVTPGNFGEGNQSLLGDRAVVGTELFEYAGLEWRPVGHIPALETDAEVWGGFRWVSLVPNHVVAAGSPNNADPAKAHLIPLAGVGDPLVGCPPELSLLTGGTQDLHIQVSPEHAGRFHFVLGSASGSTPGFDSGGHHFPLNPDAYFWYTLSSPNFPPPLLNSFGQLDAAGAARAWFVIPPGLSPSLAGVELNHACAILTLDLETVEVTNATPLLFVD